MRGRKIQRSHIEQKNIRKIPLENIRNLLDFSRIYISLSKKMELVFTFWHKIFNSYLINQTKP